MLNIDQKAKELYEKRIAPYAKDISPSQKKSIINFQKLIFKIDQYGESVNDIDSIVLGSLWKQLEHSLDDLKVEKSMQALLLKDIKDYADMEISIREGKKLIDYDIRPFYFKKSCDVRLQRHLIRYLNEEDPISSEDEIIKDILEEIEDDVDDIEEDRGTLYNGNRFLEAIDSNNKNKIEEYVNFINSLNGVPKELIERIILKLKGTSN